MLWSTRPFVQRTTEWPSTITGLVDWTGGLDWWTDTKNSSNEIHMVIGLHDATQNNLLTQD